LIVDTNALSAICDGDPQIKPLVQKASHLALTVITLGEYRFGVLQSRRRLEYEEWLDSELHRFTVLPVTNITSRFYAGLRSELKRGGTPIPSNDIWIAALSREHNLPVLSRDGHFDRVPGLRRLTW
jgi:tRNA(fMet)-specific endonuclease VapC